MARKPRQIDRQKLIDAAMTVIARDGFAACTLETIAEEVSASPQNVRSVFGSVYAILEALVDGIDRNALMEGEHFQDDDSVRDRLFALLMARFDALDPYKQAIRRMSCAPSFSHMPLLALGPRLLCSMALMLETAGSPPSGLSGMLRTKGLAGIHLSAMRVWLSDDSQDMAETMAYLDKCLSRAENLVQALSGVAGKA